MKTHALILGLTAVGLLGSVNAQNRSESTPNAGSAGATARQSGATSGSATSDSTKDGIILHNNNPYVVRNGVATRVDNTTLRSGQMMTDDGRIVNLPDGVTGIPRATAATSPGPGSGSATARLSGATSGTTTTTANGLVLHDGNPYVVRNGAATRLEPSAIPAGQMMTFDGRLIERPENIRGLEAEGTSSSTANPSR